MPQLDRQRKFALQIVQKLRASGFEALWAGGCVRDQLLGLMPKDYDVATNATPEQIRDLFGRRRTLPIGAAFGVITVLGPRAAGQIEVATFRTDAPYSDGRHPDSVSFTDAQHDAQRRDFTINGLFYDPIAEQVVDYVDGQKDIESRIIRAIGNPLMRLNEDKLRMLRAVRFAATFDFEIDVATLNAIQEMAADIKTVSAERIGMEIRRMLMDPNRATALELLRESNLLPHVLPEVSDLDATAFKVTKRRLGALHSATLPLALATLLSTHAGPLVTEIEAADPNVGSMLSASLARRLRYTNKEADRTTWLLQKLPLLSSASHLPWPRLQRILTHDGAVELLQLYEVIAGLEDPNLEFCRKRLAWPPEKLNPPPLVDGSDLIAHGLKPGPEFSVLLEKIRDAQLDGIIHSREEALTHADRLRAEQKSLP